MATKVLVVLDGVYRFDLASQPAGQLDFTFTILVSTLAAAGFDVTKAHRGTDSSATPGFDSFRFNALPAGHSLLEFDAIWLIGFEGRNSPTGVGSSTAGGLGTAQLNAIATYMESGGGIFAVGDHDSIGADMSGYIPRVRAMRAWYGAGDPASPMPAGFPANFPPLSPSRADTTQTNPAGIYTAHAAPFVWFENQSDSVPQPITPTTSPAHPILRRNGHDIVVFPDHMHEGRTLGEVPGYIYSQPSPFGDTTKAEFRDIAGYREPPAVIATGHIPGNAVYSIGGDGNTDATVAVADPTKPANTLCVYDGRAAGVGRVVTGATFHHYIDINLSGDTDVTPGTRADQVGADAIKGHGYNDNPAVFDEIKAVYVNITNWIARPSQVLTLILERSTFSQDEVGVTPQFDGAILVTIDGLKPNQFPGGGIPALGPIAGPAPWAPVIAAPAGRPIAFDPTFVDSDDPSLADRLQRITVTYRVRFTGNPFPAFAGTVPITATLNSVAALQPLTDTAWLQLVTSANPFMLDLADGNVTTWLSSDVKVFHVVEGQTFLGVPLPLGATRADALGFINTLTSTISTADFTNLPPTEEDSVLSSLATTTSSPALKVYNFAIARVRLSSAGADANQVRVFFRIFTSQTTAALTYRLDGGGMPVEGYLKTAGASPIALPGTQNGGNDWVSFPCFASSRASDPASQQDVDNVKPIQASVGFKVFGALVDNNLSDPYLPPTPGSTGPVPLPTLMMGEHQCVVAQIEYGGAPIPSGATPWTSDKLSQRNLALSPVANPGLDASRVAMHTFEIEATPNSVTSALPPDELLLDWSSDTPSNTVLRIHIPSWKAKDVVDLATQIYPRHEIQVIDENTIELPAGGTRYVPIPQSTSRQTGVISAEFPLGIRKGQRFDVSVRQITNRQRRADIPPSKVTEISQAEAAKLLDALPQVKRAGGALKGAFDLGESRVLVTDLSLFDASGDHALLIQHPTPMQIDQAQRDSGQWRETIGAFQLGVPVSTKPQMLLHQMRLLSVMRWRTGMLPRNSRWRKTMQHYVALLADKVQALGGNPWAIPATPDGSIPQLSDDGNGCSGDTGGCANPNQKNFKCLLPWRVCRLERVGFLLFALFVIWLLFYH